MGIKTQINHKTINLKLYIKTIFILNTSWTPILLCFFFLFISSPFHLNHRRRYFRVLAFIIFLNFFFVRLTVNDLKSVIDFEKNGRMITAKRSLYRDGKE